MQAFHPYDQEEHDRLAQLCQVQIFFALLSSLSLKYAILEDTQNIDVLLSIVTYIPIGLSVYLETPLAEHLTTGLCKKKKAPPAYASHSLESSNVSHLSHDVYVSNVDPGCASASSDAEHTEQQGEVAHQRTSIDAKGEQESDVEVASTCRSASVQVSRD